ncbi:MAG: aminotransferase class I/II-fold pyridoxal phosphate-dependent enzyme [Tatlockia sp.]|jgi:aspartate aminotransferase/aminotransferase
MFMPNGQSADKTDKIMLLAMWAKTLKEESSTLSLEHLHSTIISAGMGKPTYPININTIAFFQSYWKRVEELAVRAMQDLEVIQEGAAIDYGDPQGDKSARAIMAQAMTRWYDSEIKAEHVLFTAGGAGALRTIFETFNGLYKTTSGYRIITPFPHYTLYSDNPMHRLHPVDVMQEPGYRLTAEAIEASIKSAIELAQKDGGFPRAILLCNPSNPLGTVIDKAEWIKIANVLRKYPDLQIVLDEAYAEMAFVDLPSLIKIAPDLKERTTILRSATKALSAAGERMAILLNFNPAVMSEFLSKSISLMGHTPRSSQEVYAKTMADFDENERLKRINFYKTKVDYIVERIKAMGAAMPDVQYQTEATFYVLANLSDLFGMELPSESMRALGKGGVVTTDEELTYYLLFEEGVMIAPLSYFGLPKDNGYIRITCSGDEQELNELMNRIERQLLKAREAKQLALIERITAHLPELKAINVQLHDEMSKKIQAISSAPKTCLSLKHSIEELTQLSSEVNTVLQRNSVGGEEKAAITLQSFFRGRTSRKETKLHKNAYEKEWKHFVDGMFSDSCPMKNAFLSSKVEDRLKFAPWREHLKNMEVQSGVNKL